MNNNYLINKDLSLLLEEKSLSNKDIAFKTNISLRTIDDILSNSYIPKDDILDKFYSLIYDEGLRINKIKEEIFKETSNQLVLFHGAKEKIEKVTHNGSKENSDFGKGFYLGESYFQTSSFVYDIPHSSIYAFNLNIKNLKIVELSFDLDWMLLVCYYRKMLEGYSNHPIIIKLLNKINDVDVIIAPIADNKMFNIMRKFGLGDITSKQAIHSLASSDLGKQYVLKSKKAISNLKQIERLFISSSERKQIIKQMDERGKEIDTKLNLSRREFKKEGLYIDEVFK